MLISLKLFTGTYLRKKLFKSVLSKYPKFSGWCSYINKKGNIQVRAFIDGKEKRF